MKLPWAQGHRVTAGIMLLLLLNKGGANFPSREPRQKYFPPSFDIQNLFLEHAKVMRDY
jgi:hypothetical protein